LTAHRQIAPMAEAAITANLFQAGNILLFLAAQLTFNRVFTVEDVGDPRDLFFAPIEAVRSLMAKAGTSIGDYDLIEANEAFAVQAIADGRALGWDWDRVNVNGGAVALGHPIGASGARVLTTLVHALRDRKQATGLATLCLGGGNAVALSVEML